MQQVKKGETFCMIYNKRYKLNYKAFSDEKRKKYYEYLERGR